MTSIQIHGKKLPVPSFFQVYNFGGGNGDKDREIVYAELTTDTPALVNYFYISNRYPHLFQSSLFNDMHLYNRVGDLYNHIRTKLIEKGEIYSGYTSSDYDFNSKVFLLDSGAFSIVKYVAEQVDYDADRFRAEIVKHATAYYDFAHALHFDIVVGFDLGGKYTKKDGEGQDAALNAFFSRIDPVEINNLLLDETAKYLSVHNDYYPCVMATVHGNTPKEYRDNVALILELERSYTVRFWGFALGGIASYKQVDPSWYNNINLTGIGKRGYIETITPAKACKIVRSMAGARPIHALGCGGYNNIALNYYNGATSFDAASPVRRVGDGSFASTRIVFNPKPSSESFSKFFMGGINMNGSIRPEACGYKKLNEIPDKMPLCGCPACTIAGNVHRIKELYAMKATDSEANYFSRQLIGLHAVMQHRKLCQVIASFDTMEDFCKAYPSTLNIDLQLINKQL